MIAYDNISTSVRFAPTEDRSSHGAQRFLEGIGYSLSHFPSPCVYEDPAVMESQCKFHRMTRKWQDSYVDSFQHRLPYGWSVKRGPGFGGVIVQVSSMSIAPD